MSGRRPGDLVAVVLTYQGGRQVHACLDALVPQLGPTGIVVVVDNASGDGTAQAVQSEHPSVTVVHSPSNGGYGSGMNLGLAQARTHRPDRVLLLTHDTVLEDGAVDALCAALDDHDGAAAAGPLLLLDDGRVWSAGGELTGLGRHPRHRGRGEAAAAWRRAPARAVPWLDGAALLLRTSALASLSDRDRGGPREGLPGPFREDFFLYWEEVELQARLSAAGWDLLVVPRAAARQHPGMMPPYLASRNRIRFLTVTGARGPALCAAAGDCARAAKASLHRRSRWQARAHLAGLRDGWRGGLDRELAARR